MRASPAPIVCLVTDRVRAAVGVPGLSGQIASLVKQAVWAADAGIDLIQVRERDLEAAPLTDVVLALLAAIRGSATRIVVNERVDVAITTGAHGVHLRSDSVGCARVRSIAPPPFAIGRSVHAAGEAQASADGADYLVAGTVFRTASKPDRTELIGLDGLRGIAKSVATPVLAIGGITVERVSAVASTGAAGVAAIGLFLGSDGPCALSPIVAAIRREFAAGAALRPPG